jgi:hypothetical protein
VNPNTLKECIEDSKAVRANALANAKQALEDAFNSKFNEMFMNGLKTTNNDDGSIRYTIRTPDDVEAAYEDIEKNGYIILDEDENGDWIDAVNPHKMEQNIRDNELYNKMADDLATEIDKEILDTLIKATKDDEEKKLKNRYYKFRSWIKGSPCPVNESAIPTFHQWKESEKNVH